jgi:hypothetical protein
MATQHFSWYLAKQLRFVSSGLGNVSEACFAKRPCKIVPRPGGAILRRRLGSSLQESARGMGADVELAGGTVERCALAVHRR